MEFLLDSLEKKNSLWEKQTWWTQFKVQAGLKNSSKAKVCHFQGKGNDLRHIGQCLAVIWVIEKLMRHPKTKANQSFLHAPVQEVSDR